LLRKRRRLQRMGLDITCVYQIREADRWLDVAIDRDGSRDYAIFDWLGLGSFSRTIGTYTFEPLAPLRGFPADFEIVNEAWHPTRIEIEKPSPYYPNCVFMGAVGCSWLLSGEIIRARAPRVTRTLNIPIGEYRQWDGVSTSTPWQWATTNFGHVVGMPDKITTLAEEVVVEWDYDFTEDFSYFVDKVRRLETLHGEVRLVFGFA
jgi:hypothetical protein